MVLVENEPPVEPMSLNSKTSLKKTPSKITPSKITPSKMTPSKINPSKVTPTKSRKRLLMESEDSLSGMRF